jgi:membrane protein
MKKLKTFWKLLKQAYESWNSNDPWARSAIIAYYTLFSLPSLMIIIVSIAGYFFGREAVQGRITGQITEFIGKDSAMIVENMISNAALSSNSTLAIIFGVFMLLFGATGVFFQLKKAMNNIWNVAEKKDTYFRMFMDRVISFGMILVIGFLMLLGLIVSAIIRMLSDYIKKYAPALTDLGLEIVNSLLSLVFITLLFASIFKLLPDIKIRWKITLYGAALTTVLFLIGENLIGIYFGRTDPASVYGGASSMVLILLWVNYTCLIMFYGAEFTVQYARHIKEKITPTEFGEPAIQQELEKLDKKKEKLRKDDKVMKDLESNSPNTN